MNRYLMMLLVFIVIVSYLVIYYCSSSTIHEATIYKEGITPELLKEPIKYVSIVKTSFILRFYNSCTNHFSHWALMCTTDKFNQFIISTTRHKTIEIWPVIGYIKKDKLKSIFKINKSEVTSLNDIIKQLNLKQAIIDLNYIRNEYNIVAMADYNRIWFLCETYPVLYNNISGNDVIAKAYKHAKEFKYQVTKFNCHFTTNLLINTLTKENIDNIKDETLFKQISSEILNLEGVHV